jgi:hypothetical protein
MTRSKNMDVHKTDPVEYQTKCEILTDLCVKWLDKFPALTSKDYDDLMTKSQEVFNNQKDKN